MMDIGFGNYSRKMFLLKYILILREEPLKKYGKERKNGLII